MAGHAGSVGGPAITFSPTDLALYTGALLLLFLTPGPVWLAMTARAMSGGFHAAWPLALGVVVGDVLWPLAAIAGINWILQAFGWLTLALKGVAVAMFAAMGLLLIRNADAAIAADSRLTRPGMWAGFAAGLAAILGNPKAILFYIGVLPGFFDLTRVTVPDIAAIVFLSAAVPLVGNLAIALCIDRARRFLESPQALRRANVCAGIMLIAVGVAIAVL